MICGTLLNGKVRYVLRKLSFMVLMYLSTSGMCSPAAHVFIIGNHGRMGSNSLSARMDDMVKPLWRYNLTTALSFVVTVSNFRSGRDSTVPKWIDLKVVIRKGIFCTNMMSIANIMFVCARSMSRGTGSVNAFTCLFGLLTFFPSGSRYWVQKCLLQS